MRKERVMKAKWMTILAIALMLPGCTSMNKLRVQKAGKDLFFVEVEEFNLTNAQVQELEGASGGKVVVLQDKNSKAEATIPLKKSKYEITVYALGPSYDEDAFYIKVGDNAEERRWTENIEEILPTLDVVNFTQKTNGPCNILLRFVEPNVKLDRVEFKHIP
jgi:hypothetical protein